MNRLWTADDHLGGANIHRYTGNVFPTKEAREAAIIRNANGRIKDGDIIISVGDFCSYGKEKGVEGSRIKATQWEKLFKGKWIFMAGNHDANNSVKFGIESMVVKIGPYNAFVVHDPKYGYNAPPKCDLVICGHVHQAWHTQWRKHGKCDILYINVGVDVNRYMPISDSEIISLADREYRKLYIGTKPKVAVTDITCKHDGTVYKSDHKGGCPACKARAMAARLNLTKPENMV